MADDESKEERVNRELTELLNELRVALPGVQVLFAFLLTVPFSQRFADVSAFQRDIYFITLVTAALSCCLLITPSAQHRLLFRMDNKEQLLIRANRYSIAGLGLLAVALASALLFVADFLFSQRVAILATTVLALVLLWLWVLLPLSKRDGARAT